MENVEDQNMEEAEVHLRDYLAVLYKRRWTLAASFFIIVAAAAVYTFSATPVYLARSALIIEKENPNLLSIEEVLAVNSTDTDYYQTQFKLIESRTVAREVVRRMDLGNSEEFNPPPPDDLFHVAMRWWRGRAAAVVRWVGNVIRRDQAPNVMPIEETGTDMRLVDAFLGRIRVEPLRNSRMVHVGVEAADPALAAKMANTLVAAYIDQNLETKLAAAKEAVQWLAQRIDEERGKVERAELALLRYKEENGITADRSADVEQITAQKLVELDTQLIEARSLRVEAETRYRQATALAGTPEALDAIPEVMENSLVGQIKRLEVDLYNRISEYSGKYGANHPKMLAARAELEELNKRKQQEVQRVVRVLKNKFELAMARENSLRGALDEQRRDNLTQGKKAVRLTVLQRQAESSRHMYELLIKRFKETSLTEEMRHGNVRVVDPAEVPRAPVKPNKKRNLLLAVVVGLMAGMGLCFFIEYLDNSIKLPDEVRNLLGIPYLGPIPAGPDPTSSAESLVIDHQPKSALAESFRGLRTGIQFSSADSPPRVILVTSADRAEGKTFVSCNLALTLARGGHTVALVDGDMHKPRVHRVLGLRRPVGLSNYLSGSDELDTVLTSTAHANLSAICCGPVPPDPSELLSSSRLRTLIAELRARAHYVVIDSPPLSAVTDAALMAAAVDGVMMVIKAGDTPRPIIHNAVEQLRTVHARILGAVLNGVVMGRHNYCYYQYHDGYQQDEIDRKSRNDRQPRNTMA